MLDKLKKRYISKLSLLVILFVFVITLLISVISSLITSKIILTETGNYNLLYLNRLNTLIDNELNSIDRDLLRFCQKNITAENIARDLSGYYERYLLAKKIDSLAEENEYVNSTYIFFNDGANVYYHSVFNTMKADGIVNTAAFFDRQLYDGFISKPWLSKITGSRLIKPGYASDPANGAWVVSFVKRISINDAMSRNVIVININASHLMDMIRTTNMPKGSAVIVTDDSGAILLSYSEATGQMIQPDGEQSGMLAFAKKDPTENNKSYTEKISNEAFYVTQLRSASDGKTYKLIIPEKELLKSITLFNTSMIIVASAILLLGFFFAHAVDSSYFRPIMGILIKLKNKDTFSGRQAELETAAHGKRPISPAAIELKQIDSYIDDMITRNLKQEAQLRSYFSCYKEKMLLSLLNGDSETIRLIHEEKIIFGSELKSFCVVAAAFGNEGSAIDGRIFENYVNTINMQVENSLMYFGKVESIKTGNRTAFLLNMEGGTESGQIKERLLSNVVPGIGSRILYMAGIGGISANMQGICSSYLEALRIIEQMELLNQTGFYDIDDIKKGESSAYPHEIEEQLAAHVGAGLPNCSIDDIRRFCFDLKKNATHINDVKKYTFRLVFNISRKTEKSRTEDEPLLTESTYGDLHGKNTVQDIEEWLISIIGRSFAKPAHEAGNSSNNKEMIDKVIKYIQAHYMEDIGLNTIAYHIYLSPSYLSKLFREESGYTFTDYLIKVRMEAAAGLLLDKNANISSIVGKVGYFSVQSFCRLFKSYFKCSPSEYRRRFAVTELSGEASDIS